MADEEPPARKYNSYGVKAEAEAATRGVQNCRIIRHKKALSEMPYRGDFVPWDNLVPFNCTRTNTLFNVPSGVIRGLHAHITVHELVVCLTGAMSITVEDLTGSKTMRINSPLEGAYLCPGVWITLHDFEAGTNAIVLCSGEYDEKDVIRTREAYDRFSAAAAADARYMMGGTFKGEPETGGLGAHDA